MNSLEKKQTTKKQTTKNNVSRRDFFKLGATAAAVTGIFGIFSSQGQVAQAEERRKKKDSAAAGDQLCDPNSGVAKGMNYQAKHTDVKNAALKVEKQGLKFDQQFCNNCSFYAKKSAVNGKEVGACQIIPGCVVASEGWCSSWNKKA
ncbi:MAG: high-potential iron-sulfur protein [Pseudobdellovibrionaceae bacterium]